MSSKESDVLRAAHGMIYTTSPPLHAEDRFIKWKLFPAWREGKFANLDESKLCGEYGTWSRLRELQKEFPAVPLEKLFHILRRAGALRSKADSLATEGKTKEQCLSEIGKLFPEFPEDLQRMSVDHSYRSEAWARSL